MSLSSPNYTQILHESRRFVVFLSDEFSHGLENGGEVLNVGYRGRIVDFVAINGEGVQTDDFEDLRRHIRHNFGRPVLVACLELRGGKGMGLELDTITNTLSTRML